MKKSGSRSVSNNLAPKFKYSEYYFSILKNCSKGKIHRKMRMEKFTFYIFTVIFPVLKFNIQNSEKVQWNSQWNKKCTKHPGSTQHWKTVEIWFSSKKKKKMFKENMMKSYVNLKHWQLEWLAKVFGPFNFCIFFPHFRLKT